MSTFQNEFGRKIALEPITCSDIHLLEIDLKNKFHEEYKALDDLAQQIKLKTNNIQKSHQKFIDCQYQTDLAWKELMINSDTTE